MTWVLLNLIYGTYTNADIPLTLNMEDKNTFPCCRCNALDPLVAKYEALKTGYFLKYSTKIILVTRLRVLNMKSKELP